MFSGAKTKMFDRVLQDTVRLRTIKFSQRDLIWLNITSQESHSTLVQSLMTKIYLKNFEKTDEKSQSLSGRF